MTLLSPLDDDHQLIARFASPAMKTVRHTDTNSYKHLLNSEDGLKIEFKRNY